MPPYLAGHDMEAILHAFPELAPAAPRPEGRRYYSRKDIEQNRAARREIWQHLADGHGATVAHHPLRHHVVRRRADMLSLPGGPD